MPQTAPYAQDSRPALRIPTNTTDWVLVEMRDSNDIPQIAQSGLLQADGVVCGYDGASTLSVEVPEGHYRIVAKHRNHLAAMSAATIPLTNQVALYDFTSNSSQYAGGTNACVELEPGVYFLEYAPGDQPFLLCQGGICWGFLGGL